MFRFLFTRRWIGLLLAVVVVGIGCVELGRWQFSRYDARHDDNATTKANLDAPPVPVDELMSVDSPPGPDDEWRVVVAEGTYDADQEIVVTYRTRDGAPGVDVVVPLVTGSGTAVLVDRGWIQTSGNGNESPETPAPPAGEVTIEGWIRINASGDETVPNEGSVRAISSTSIGATLPYPVYDGFLDLIGEDPEPTDPPARASPPDLGSGPHFFYGLQWFFFALLAFGFWCYFAWAEWRSDRDKSGVSPPPGTVDSAEPQE